MWTTLSPLLLFLLFLVTKTPLQSVLLRFCIFFSRTIFSLILLIETRSILLHLFLIILRPEFSFLFCVFWQIYPNSLLSNAALSFLVQRLNFVFPPCHALQIFLSMSICKFEVTFHDWRNCLATPSYKQIHSLKTWAFLVLRYEVSSETREFLSAHSFPLFAPHSSISTHIKFLKKFFWIKRI